VLIARHRPEQTTLYRLLLNGVYRCDADGKPTLVEVGSPTD
jgi:hypothetical protein